MMNNVSSPTYDVVDNDDTHKAFLGAHCPVCNKVNLAPFVDVPGDAQAVYLLSYPHPQFRHLGTWCSHITRFEVLPGGAERNGIPTYIARFANGETL